MTATAVIALGSNLEEPAKQVEAALAAIAALPDVQLLRRSACFLTSPVGYADQPDFINAVCEVATTLSPEALLEALLQVEQQFGRVRTFRNAPRVLDLDLLLMGDHTCESPYLTLPHPRMHERAFVMVPLADMAPSLPVGNRGTAADIAANLDQTGVRRWAG